MQNFASWHGTIGGIVVILNLLVGISLMGARRNKRPIGAFQKIIAYIGQLSLLIQVLIGLDLWMRGARPATGTVWSYLHLLLPLGALLFSIMMLSRLRKQPAKEHATVLSKAAWHAALVALVTYFIGMMG